MKDKVESIKKELTKDLDTTKSVNELNELKVKYLGKKGTISELLSNMADLTIEGKKELGQIANELKTFAATNIEKKITLLKEKELDEKLSSDKIDVTLPGVKMSAGFLHPIQRIIDEACTVFTSMGYDVVTGPEVEIDKYNFEMLNLPKGQIGRAHV